MRRVVILLVLAGCWRGTPPEPPPAAPPVVRIADASEDAPICDRFDANNPACKDACPRDAPPDWPYCRDQQLALLGRGYACTSGSPWSCTPAPPKPPCAPGTCQPVHARVISIRVTGSDLEVTAAAGSDRGITTTWKATLADLNKNPIAGGAVTILRIDQRTTVGRISATMNQLRATPYVLFEP